MAQRQRRDTAVRQVTCDCGSMITLVPLTDDMSVMIPIDVDRDGSGDLVVIGGAAGYTIRPVAPGEEPEPRFRRQSHWSTCPHRHRWEGAMRAAGVGGASSGQDRSGPCVRCRVRHPRRYGGPVASPLCDNCRTERGMPPIGQK